MTDTAPITYPPSRLDRVKSVIADLARPFAIYVSSVGAAWATVVIAYKVETFAEAALFIGAVYTGLAGLYGFKAWENNTAAKHTAEVETAKVQAGAPTQ